MDDHPGRYRRRPPGQNSAYRPTHQRHSYTSSSGGPAISTASWPGTSRAPSFAEQPSEAGGPHLEVVAARQGRAAEERRLGIARSTHSTIWPDRHTAHTAGAPSARALAINRSCSIVRLLRCLDTKVVASAIIDLYFASPRHCTPGRSSCRSSGYKADIDGPPSM